MRHNKNRLKSLSILCLLFVISLTSVSFANDNPDICEITSQEKTFSPVDNYNLAHIYEEGLCNLEKNAEKSKNLYLKSAENGYAPAQYKLGEINFTGKYGEPNYPEAKSGF